MVGSLNTIFVQRLLGEKSDIKVKNDAILSIVFCGTSLRLIDSSLRLYLGCGFRPPQSFCGHSAVNTIGKEAVLPRASAQIVSSGTV